MSLTGKIAVVTGASSGIGLATARALAREGAAVVAVARSGDRLAEVVTTLANSGAGHAAVAVDVTASDAPARIVGAAVERFGRVDVLVNAAGILAAGTVESTNDDEWDRMFAVNLRAAFRLIREAVPHLAAARGTVVNVSSVTGLRSFAGILAYAVSKAGVDQLTRCAALELARKGVRVNAVCPGVVVTNLHRAAGMDEQAYAAFLERSADTHPLGRPGRAEEVADLVLFLASDRSGWITGETIAIDGGRHLTCAR